MANTILIVEDEAPSRRALEVILAVLGCRLEMAANGREALEKLRDLTPDLILMDVMMPAANGFDTCRAVRADPRLAEVPILILTALEDKSYRIEGIEAGADDFLQKPIDRGELLARVRTILRLNRYRKLLDQRESLRELAGRISLTQEAERARIARELHDDLGQDLIALDLALHRLRQEAPGAASRIDAILSEVSRILGKTRRLAEGLRPPALDALGLRDALSNLAVDLGERAGLAVHLDIDASADDVQDPYAITLYRVLQEALTNIIKHAAASKVWVDLDREGDLFTLEVQDNGRGFPPQPAGGGLGLDNMRERLSLVGGSLRISSQEGGGTVLTAEVRAPTARQEAP